MCEWRGGFASAALAIVNAFFDANDYDSDESCQEFAASALESFEFLYRDVSTLKDGEVSVPILSIRMSIAQSFFRSNARVSLAGHLLFKRLQPTSLQLKVPYVYQALEPLADPLSHSPFLRLQWVI